MDWCGILDELYVVVDCVCDWIDWCIEIFWVGEDCGIGFVCFGIDEVCGGCVQCVDQVLDDVWIVVDCFGVYCQYFFDVVLLDLCGYQCDLVDVVIDCDVVLWFVDVDFVDFVCCQCIGGERWVGGYDFDIDIGLDVDCCQLVVQYVVMV